MIFVSRASGDRTGWGVKNAQRNSGGANRARFVSVVMVICASLTSAYAELSARHLLAMPSFGTYSQFATSPDARYVVYTVNPPAAPAGSAADAKPREATAPTAYSTELWITDLSTLETKRICCTEGGTALDPSWSPDGRYLAFFRSKVRYEGTRGIERKLAEEGSLAIWDRENRSLKYFLEGQLAQRAVLADPFWLEDCHSLFVLTRPHASPVAGSQREGEGAGIGSPDRTEVNLDEDSTIRVSKTGRIATETGVRKEEQEDDEQKWVREYLRSDAVIVDIRSGGSKGVLTEVFPSNIALSPDRRLLVYTNFRGMPSNSMYQTHDIHLLNLKTLEDQKIFSDDVLYASVVWPFSFSPDGRFLTFPSESNNDEGRRAFNFLVMDLSNRSLRRLKRSEDPEPLGAVQVSRAIWSADGRYLSFLRTNRVETWAAGSGTLISKISIPDKDLLGIVAAANAQEPSKSGAAYSLLIKVRDRNTLASGFWKIWPASSKAEKVLEDEKSFSAYSVYDELVAGGSQVLFVWESVDRPPELNMADSEFKKLRRITNLGASLDHVEMGHSKTIRWHDAAGNENKGALLLPAGYEPGKRYPVIVQVYPGPMSWYVNRFGMSGGTGPYQNGQVYATRGYAVFRPDTPVTLDITAFPKSVIPGIEKLIEMGVADPGSIGVTGHSAGGSAALALLVQSPMFKVGVVLSGPGNLLEEYSYDYGRRVLEESYNVRKTPWDDRNYFIENSPYFFLDRIQAPVMIVSGSLDSGVPLHLSEAVFAGLRRLGKEAVFIEYKGEGHDPGGYTLPHQLDLCDRMVVWFDTYLKPRRHAGDVLQNGATVLQEQRRPISPARNDRL